MLIVKHASLLSMYSPIEAVLLPGPSYYPGMPASSQPHAAQICLHEVCMASDKDQRPCLMRLSGPVLWECTQLMAYLTPVSRPLLTDRLGTWMIS